MQSEIKEKITDLFNKVNDLSPQEQNYFDNASEDLKLVYLYKIKKNEKAFALLIDKYNQLYLKINSQISKFSTSDFESDYLEILLKLMNYIDFSKITNPNAFSFGLLLKQQCLKYVNSVAKNKENTNLSLFEDQEKELPSKSEADIASSILIENTKELANLSPIEKKIIETKHANPNIKKKDIAKELNISVFALSRYLRDIREQMIGAGLNSTRKTKITKTQEKILEVLKTNPNIKQKDVCKKLGFSKSTVSREISRLKKMGVIE